MDASYWIPVLLGLAVLMPLVSFFVILIAGARWMGKAGEHAAPVAIAAIGLSALLSFVSLGIWLKNHWPSSAHASAADHHAAEGDSSHAAPTPAASHDHHPSAGAADAHPPAGEGAASGAGAAATEDAHEVAEAHGHAEPAFYTGEYNVPGLGVPWVLGKFGDLRVSISYYVDALTVCMFCMVTFIATLIHIYAMGYMHDELHDITDREVMTSDGHHLHRPGRFHRFFQYLSLFCFSMLGVVISGNIAMVFIFWELVGICSYFLIGFYVERKSASTAANKAFIVNRVGDFGMIIGLMALWTGLGTFSFGEIRDESDRVVQRGIFELVRPAENGRKLEVPEGMLALASRDEIAAVVRNLGPDATQQQIDAAVAQRVQELDAAGSSSQSRTAYWLLIVAGIGIFTGCVGKSAQFPLHVWLPDAMEGPTPVSALVHSATMVAAGVYLVGRFYPVFTPEVLLVIATIGTITLFIAATIAITATDIKRVLAYSTVSQLGYMMMSLGLGGWLAGMLHLITHAFFKSLLFMCSGSVIHAVHTNDMREMGGLRRKMPVTAYTMLVGCLAIAGAGIPFLVGMLGGSHLAGLGFSGFYSKDAILEQAFSFWRNNTSGLTALFFFASAGGAAITAFYMFRMWYMTFAGTPRNAERYDHAHESPAVMYVPLIILSVMAISVAWTPFQALIGGLIGVVVFSIAKLFRKPAEDHAEAHGHVHTSTARASHDAHGSTHAASSAHAAHGVHTSHAAHDDHAAHGAGHHDDHHHGHAGATRSFPLADLPLAISMLILVIAFCEWLAYRAGNVPVFTDLTLANLLESARPAGTALDGLARLIPGWRWPSEHAAHDPAIVVPVTIIAIGTAFSGFLLATVMYGLRRLNAEEARRQFQPVYRLLVNKWWFDELYDWLFVRPTFVVSQAIARFDRNWIDWFIDNLAKGTRLFSVAWDRVADRSIVDGLVNLIASWTYSTGLSMRQIQTGRLRQYVMFIVIGAVTIFILISLWNTSLAA